MLLNHGVSVDITGSDGRIPLRAADCNVHLQVTRQLLSNGCSVHIARKRDLTALQAAGDSDHVEVLCELLKHHVYVVTAITKCSELLKAAAVKSHVDVVLELLKIGDSVEDSKTKRVINSGYVVVLLCNGTVSCWTAELLYNSM